MVESVEFVVIVMNYQLQEIMKVVGNMVVELLQGLTQKDRYTELMILIEIKANYYTYDSFFQTIDIAVQLTKSHLGYFEFRLCPQNNPLVPATQECLDQNLLELGDGSGQTKFIVDSWDDKFYNTTVKLPVGLTCRQCVLQWHYKTANSFGECEDGSFQMGCGDQEVFRACADVRIVVAEN